jgi:PAS domain S-box-containing protein
MPTPRHAQRDVVLRYLLAVLVTTLAVILTRVVVSLTGPVVLPVFILAVVVVSLYGGRGPGLLALLLCGIALRFWFFEPSGSMALVRDVDRGREILFVAASALMVIVAGNVYVQRLRAVEQAKENARLRVLAEEAALKAEAATKAALESSRQVDAEAAKVRDAARAAQEAAERTATALAGQRDAQEALRQSETELSDFFETASTPMHWVDANGVIIRANRAELEMMGYARDEYVGHHIEEFYVDQAVIEDLLRRLVAGETTRQYSAQVRCKNGQIRYVAIDSSGYFQDGRFVHTRCFTRDVTSEREAREAAARLVAIVSSSSDAIIGKTLDGIITSWNASAERIFGYSAEEMIGQSVFKLVPPELHEAERQLLDRLKRGESVAFSESERIRKDGKRVWISLSVSPIRDEFGTITGAASIKRDITELRALQKHVHDTQRLQAVGQLAGGIAHEANNQMSVVLGGAHFLLRRADLPDQVRQDIEEIRQAAERTASITQQLLAFSRRQALKLQDVDLNALVQSISAVLRRSLAENQNLIIRAGALSGLVRADPRQLEQVLLNLTLNARDAMPNGGSLVVETSEVTIAAKGDSNDLPAGTYELLIVRDSGHGMEQATLDRAFDPFFTTKDVGNGTGLGLSVVHGIVTQTGGHIRVDSAPGLGTAFKLYFPIVARSDSTESRKTVEPVRDANGAVVLVVEDNELVRNMAKRALAEVGYTVLEAANGRIALELVRRHIGRLDAVVSDIGMPEMDGYQLARSLHDERRDLPLVFMTGYGDGTHRENSGERLNRPVLMKPFSPDVLVRAVGELLKRPSASTTPEP